MYKLFYPSLYKRIATEMDGTDYYRYSVVVCTRDRVDELEQCLNCLDRVRRRTPFQLVVVDNGATSDAARAAVERRGGVYLLEPVPGLSRARNRGVRSSEGAIIAFLDDDARPDPDWLARMAPEFGDARVMAVVGRILPVELQTGAQNLYRQLGGYDCGYDSAVAFDRKTPNWFELANFGGIGNGSNMAFRRDAFELWPGFETTLGRGAAIAGNEEHHAFFSLINLGYRVVYTPDAVVRHPFPATWEDFRRKQWENIKCGPAYLTFLFRNEPRYRGVLLTLVVRRLLTKIGRWRKLPADYRRMLPLWQQLPAIAWSAVRNVFVADRRSMRAPQLNRTDLVLTQSPSIFKNPVTL